MGTVSATCKSLSPPADAERYPTGMPQSNAIMIWKLIRFGASEWTDAKTALVILSTVGCFVIRDWGTMPIEHTRVNIVLFSLGAWMLTSALKTLRGRRWRT